MEYPTLVTMPFIQAEKIVEREFTEQEFVNAGETYRNRIPEEGDPEYVFLWFQIKAEGKQICLQIPYDEYVKLIVSGISTYKIGLPVAQ